MKTIIQILICLTLVTNLVHGQDAKRIILFDKANNTPIPFAQIYDEVSLSATISEDNGAFKFELTDANKTFIIRHLLYEKKRIDGQLLLEQDTVFLSLRNQMLPEVIVLPSKETDVLYNMLNSVLKTSRKKDLATSKDTYIFYLESNTKGKKVEKIKSVLSLDYALSNGFSNSSFYNNYGIFLFDTAAPFLNLQTNEWLTEFDPISKKKNFESSFMATNSAKVKRSNFVLQKEYSDELLDAETEVTVYSKSDSSFTSVIMDNDKMIFKEIRYFDQFFSESPFLRLDESTAPISNLRINYVFNNDGTKVDFIDFKFDLMFENTMTIKGFLKRQPVKKSDIMVLGNYKPNSLYEQIILNPSNWEAEINNIFSDLDYSSYQFSGTEYVNSSNPEIKQSIIGRAGTTNARIWQKTRLESADYSIVFVTPSKHYDPSRGAIPRIDKPDISWVFSFKDVKENVQIESVPSVWNTYRSWFYSNTSDTLYCTFRANIIFDLYEIERLKVLKEARTQLDKGKSVAEVKRHIAKRFAKTREDMWSLSEQLNAEVDESFLKTVELNNAIKKDNGIDNLYQLFLNQLEIIAVYPTYNSVVQKYTKAGYELKRYNTQLSVKCFKEALKMELLFINYYTTIADYSNKHLASFYARISKIYHELDQTEKSCHYLQQCKTLWPEGYKEMRERGFIHSCD